MSLAKIKSAFTEKPCPSEYAMKTNETLNTSTVVFHPGVHKQSVKQEEYSVKCNP
jgi:uncharacterized protein YlaI